MFISFKLGAGQNPSLDGLILNPHTTEFQKKVYQALLKVPYGKTITYKELSNLIQSGYPRKNLSRVVGNAIGQNQILLLIPCHRVIGSNGSLTGYAGGLARKKELLKLEGALKMNNEQLSPSDDQWQAIINNKHQADGNFWYGVTTTKIFCKPSCPSRLPKRDHVIIFDDPHEALQNGSRPCKRCRPLDRIVSNQVWVDEINHVLQTRFAEKLSLTELANLVHGDPSYLRHTYKKITGSTPQQRLTEIRLENSRKLLESKMYSVSQVGIKVGIPNIAYFISLFKKQYGQTPLQYRNKINKAKYEYLKK